jgi:putative ABC transport system permease protein
MRYAIRALFRTPSFSAIAIATIALGIAANTAIFSVVNGVLLRPLPFNDESRIVRVWSTTADEPHGGHSAGDFTDLRRNARTLEAVAGFREDMAAVSTGSSAPEQMLTIYVTSDFFPVFGTPAALGRTFDRNSPAGATLVVLSDTAWHKLFGDDASVVGRTIRIDGQPANIVGVMPHGFEWPEDEVSLWRLSPGPVPPSPIDVPDPLTNRDVNYFQAVARLKAGGSLAAAQQEVRAIASAIQRDHRVSSGGRDFALVPIREDLTGNVFAALVIIQAAVGLVLLIACANVSSLLIARAVGRRRELAIRAALGASRWDLVRQLLAESLTIGVAGGGVGLLISSWLVVLLLKLMPAALPRTDNISLDGTVMIVTLLASLATGVLFGILPALQASRTQAGSVIKQAGERGSSRARGRSVLVVGEIALTLILLVSAGLLANSFLRLQRVDPGFRAEHVTIAELMVPQSRYPKGDDQTRIYRRIIEGLRQRPELQAVGVGFPGPLHGGNAGGTFTIEGHTAVTREDKSYANLGLVSSGYFAAMGIPIVAGRSIDDRASKDGPLEVAVSLALAKKYFGGRNPVGTRIRLGEGGKDDPWFTIVGLVGDVRQMGLAEPAPPILYIPFQHLPLPYTSVTVRSALPEPAVASLLKAQLATIDRELPYGDINTLGDVVQKSVESERFRATLIGVFAMLALVLAAVGVYGLISYTVTQRTREIGIRVALGASPRHVLVAVVREGVTLAVIGIVIGLAGALLATRALTAFLFGVGAADPLTFGGVAIVLLLVATAASYIPSRRALKVDPMIALRAE